MASDFKQNTQRIPLNILEHLIIYNNATIELSVWWALAKHNIPALLLSSNFEQKAVIIARGLATRLPLRQLQQRCMTQPLPAFLLAKTLLEEKIHSYQLPLYALDSAHKTHKEGFIERCDMAYETLELMEDYNLRSLILIKQQLDQYWFKLLRHTIDPIWQFIECHDKPPRDPVNALLSLGYTLLKAEIRHILISEGLEPSVAFLHNADHDEEPLVLDIFHYFSSGVDVFVLQLLTQLKPSDFNHHQRQGCRLRKAKRRLFFSAWAHYRQQWPRPYHATSKSLANANNATIDTWQYAPLAEQLRGKVATLRQSMEYYDAKIRPQTGDVCPIAE